MDKEYDKYEDLTQDKIEKAIEELFHDREIEAKIAGKERREMKVSIMFESKEAADKWLKEVWQPLLIEAANKR